MIGAIAGLATSAIGSALASKQAAKEKQKRDALVQQKEGRINNEINFANRDRSQDATYQHLLTQGREISQEMVNNAQAMNAMGGGTEAGIATAKQQAAKANADAVAGAVVNSEQARQNELASLRGERSQVENLQINNKNADVQSAINMASNFADAGTGLMTADLKSHLDTGRGAFENLFKKGKVKQTGVII